MGCFDAFRDLKGQNSLAARLFSDQVPLVENGQRLQSTTVQRASGVFATQLLAVATETAHSRLVFICPNPDLDLARFLAVSVLMADFVSRQGNNSGVQKVRGIVRGDLILITQNIRECVAVLRGLSIRSRSELLAVTEFWDVEVLSKYTPPSKDRPRVYVANPGWPLSIDGDRNFGCVIIDATHPRTAAHLNDLLAHPVVAKAPVSILLVPPWEDQRLSRVAGNSGNRPMYWLWDPSSVASIEEGVIPAPGYANSHSQCRNLWITADEKVDEILQQLHGLLVGAMRTGKAGESGDLLEAWGLYHRLRQLTVPLRQLEEWQRVTRGVFTLKERLESLERAELNASGALGAYLQTHWQKVTDCLRSLYDVLLHRTEPAKFYTLASVVSRYVSDVSANPFRVVAPTEYEANLLASMLGDVVDEWNDALQDGRVTVTTVRQEPRLAAQGDRKHTILLGFRTSETRHLDVYPPFPVDLVGYSYEASVDHATQNRMYNFLEQFQTELFRAQMLGALGLAPQASLTTVSSGGGVELLPSTRPEVQLHLDPGVQPKTIRSVPIDSIEPLDVGKLSDSWWSDETAPRRADITGKGKLPGNQHEYLEVTDVDGESFFYALSQSIDIFYPATEILEHVPAQDLRPGMLMVVLVDDRYQDLYQRLLEAIEQERDPASSVAMSLWDRAKQIALARNGNNKRQLFEQLEREGLSVDYPAVVTWFRQDLEEIIAPQTLSDFTLLAQHTRIYQQPKQIQHTFSCIENERKLRRRTGKLLRRFLTQIASGKHYQAALESAEAIGTPLENIAAAVTLREIAKVQTVD